MSQSVKLIIFDLDGTLVDAFKAVAASLNHAMRECGYDLIDEETVKRSVGWGEVALLSKFVDAENLDKVLSIYRQHHRNALKSGTTFLPGVKKVLDALHNDGTMLAIASNRPSRFSHIILKHLSIAPLFKAVVCADQVENPKPSGDMIRKVLSQLKVSQEDALYVGDMPIDLAAGRDAGVKTVCVTTGSYDQKELLELKPSGVIEEMEQLLDLIPTFCR